MLTDRKVPELQQFSPVPRKSPVKVVKNETRAQALNPIPSLSNNNNKKHDSRTLGVSQKETPSNTPELQSEAPKREPATPPEVADRGTNEVIEASNKKPRPAQVLRPQPRICQQNWGSAFVVQGTKRRRPRLKKKKALTAAEEAQGREKERQTRRKAAQERLLARRKEQELRRSKVNVDDLEENGECNLGLGKTATKTG